MQPKEFTGLYRYLLIFRLPVKLMSRTHCRLQKISLAVWMSLLIVPELALQRSLSIQRKTLCIRWRTSWKLYMYVSPIQRFISSH